MKKKIVKIEKQDHFGRGITYIDDKICFVNNALQNEKCEVIVDNETKKFILAHTSKLLEKSIDRVEVSCPYYKNGCGGCQILHEKYDAQVKFKQKKVEEVMEKYGAISKEKVLPIIPCCNQFSYRNKVVLHIKEERLGFYQEKSKELIEIEACPLLHSSLNDVILLLKKYIKRYPGITSAVIRFGNLHDEVMLVLNGKAKKEELVSFWKEKVNTLIYQDEVLFGKGKITSKLFNQQFQVSPSSFFQVNDKQTETLYKIVLDRIKQINAKNVLDLYCGTGTIGMLLSPYVEKVIGVEVVKEAVLNAKDNQKQNNILNISFLEGKVEDHLEVLTKEIDTIVVDPPRSGLHSNVISSILKINAQNIIYVSCDVMTLARDLNLLKEKYEIEFVQPVDMFPNTYHVECVSVLHRR